MKIAYFVPSLDAKGPIFVVKSLSDLLIKREHEIIVYYFDEKEQIKFNCKTEKIAMNQKIDFDYFDILHSHCLRPDIYLSKWKKHIKHAKIISTLHQDTYQSFKYEYNVILSKIFTKYWCKVQSNFDCVVAISNQLKEYYQHCIKTKIITIYNGCILNTNNNLNNNYIKIIKQKKNEGYKIIGTYAFVTKRKGLNQVLKTLPLLNNYIFIIIGDGPEINNLKKQANELNIIDRVIFIPYQKVPSKYLYLFDVYVMPSYSEGFGLAMVEAALNGKAIVCSELPSFREIFPNNEVLFFELDNILDLSKKIELAYQKKDKLGNLSFKRASSEFRVDIMVNRYEALYESIITEKKYNDSY